MRTYALYMTSICCGFCMMALEIMGGRYLYPTFGSSIDVWAAIISVFILSLSIGYWYGGRIADKARTNMPLGLIIIGASIFYLLLPVYARPMMDIFPPEIQAARWGSLLAALILFLAPSLLLGCVSPMLVKLVFIDDDQVGRTTGTLYAIGSVGNVIGILTTNYVFLALLDLNTISISMGIVLLLVGAAHLLIKTNSQVEAEAPTPPADAAEPA